MSVRQQQSSDIQTVLVCAGTTSTEASAHLWCPGGIANLLFLFWTRVFQGEHKCFYPMSRMKELQLIIHWILSIDIIWQLTYYLIHCVRCEWWPIIKFKKSFVQNKTITKTIMKIQLYKIYNNIFILYICVFLLLFKNVKCNDFKTFQIYAINYQT